MDKIPFNIYDFFSYLFAGFWLLIGIDFVFNLHLLLGRELPPAHVAFWIIASYVVGHINSHWSAWLLEEKSLRLLGKPETLLFGEGGKRFFRHYRKSLPTRTAKLIEEKYTRMHGGGGTDLDRFIFCFNLVKEQCPQALIRLSQFLNLYGFTRNLCFATLLVTIGILGKAVLYPRSLFFILGAVGIVGTSTLYLRYLKFYRLYSVEVFTAFLVNVKDQPHALEALAATGK